MLFDWQFSKHVLQGIEVCHTEDGFKYLDIHMRYFTSQLQDTMSKDLGIPEMFDVGNALQRFKGGKYKLFFGSDNIVKYYKRDINKEGRR